MTAVPAPRFSTALAVEAIKLRRSLAALVAFTAPVLIAIFVFFNLTRLTRPSQWEMSWRLSAAVWAFFMLPMCVTALTALIAHTEHGPRSWSYLRALPIPRWHLYLSKLLCILGTVALMSLWLAALSLLAVKAAGIVKPVVAATGSLDIAAYLLLLGRVFLAALFLVAIQLWVALRFSSFVPALALGIGGTFFAVVATGARMGLALPWQIPVNQLASDPARAQLSLVIGLVAGCISIALMMWDLSRREVMD